MVKKDAKKQKTEAKITKSAISIEFIAFEVLHQAGLGRELGSWIHPGPMYIQD